MNKKNAFIFGVSKNNTGMSISGIDLEDMLNRPEYHLKDLLKLPSRINVHVHQLYSFYANFNYYLETVLVLLSI